MAAEGIIVHRPPAQVVDFPFFHAAGRNPDFPRQQIDRSRICIHQRKNLGVKMIVMLVADENHQLLSPRKIRKRALIVIKEQDKMIQFHRKPAVSNISNSHTFYSYSSFIPSRPMSMLPERNPSKSMVI